MCTTGIGFLIIVIGLILGVGTLFTQIVAVIVCGSMSKWVDPLIPVAILGGSFSVGIAAVLVGLFLSAGHSV